MDGATVDLTQDTPSPRGEDDLLGSFPKDEVKHISHPPCTSGMVQNGAESAVSSATAPNKSAAMPVSSMLRAVTSDLTPYGAESSLNVASYSLGDLTCRGDDIDSVHVGSGS